MSISTLVRNFPHSRRLTSDEAADLVRIDDIGSLLGAAARRRDAAHGRTLSYSRKVFIPLTRLCRDVCHYCTFAHPPREGEKAYLSIEQMVAIARAGKKAGCKEALFTLGDKPELRYRLAREELDRLGHPTTLSYLAAAASAVHRETGLLPHLNPGLMTGADIDALRKVSVSQGIMLESVSERLAEKGGAHHGSPDKAPAARLETMRLAGERNVPFTSGILIGIGETRQERIDSLLALRDLNDLYGHIQEIIIQNFRPKPGTRMENAAAPDVDDHLWTIAVARLIFEPSMNIQAPPNLSPGALGRLVAAGINDWGGVSPVTPDHVNPEAPWPHLRVLEAATKAAGMDLTERLAIYPAFARDTNRWLDQGLRTTVLHGIDGDGMPRVDDWCPGHVGELPAPELEWIGKAGVVLPSADLGRVLAKAQRGDGLDESEIAGLFRARGDDFTAVCRAADELRREMNGDVVSYVVTRNINYTNICSFKCQFCAFSKGKMSENLRGRPYDLDMREVADRVIEAWQRGASEVCMQGGIHPSYTGQKYLDICRTVKYAVPQIHMHAFSPLEVYQGAQTLDIPVTDFLRELKAAGLNTLPGTAAEILDDEVRVALCADKIRTQNWLDVMRAAHTVGLRSTATIMFGHIENYQHWARHLLRVRNLQSETGGFTEFVPLPFVHMEAPIYLKGRARPGPTFREAILMHAVARLALNPVIPNIQTSWVKLGAEGVRHCLSAGVNDLGGTLMDESISRSAGASHGQEMTPQEMEQIIVSIGRIPRQRTTLYGDADAGIRQRSFDSAAARMSVDGHRERVHLAAHS
jgi:FO synthase